MQNNKNYQQYIDVLKKKWQNQQYISEQIRIQVKQQLLEIQNSYCNFDEFFALMNQWSISAKKNQKKFEYEIIKDSGKQEVGYCKAIAFNDEKDLLLVACSKEIIVNKFIDGKIIDVIQRLIGHANYVTCLLYLKQSNTIISGSFDTKIIIWEMDKNQIAWSQKQKLEEHNNSVICMLINKNEQLLITGSNDKTIKFWSRTNQGWRCQQTIDSDNEVNDISLNDLENTLVSCGEQEFIQIIGKISDKHWQKVQKINVNAFGYRLGFTIENQFVFQPYCADYLEIYELEIDKRQFQKKQQIQVYSQQTRIDSRLFPCRFIQQLQIITVKHGKFLNQYKRQFQNDAFYGKMTEDGQHLVLSYCDNTLSQIQIRKFKLISRLPNE